MKFSKKKSDKYSSENTKRNYPKQLILPPDEYAKVMAELNTHLSEEDRKHGVVSKPIGNYYYTFINRGFDDYTIIGKSPIISEIEEEEEALK